MDNPQHAAFNPSAPDDERIDALTDLHKTYLPTTTELAIPNLDELMTWVNDELTLTKAIDPNAVPFPSLASKQGRAGMQSVFLDDFQLNSKGDYWERPSPLSFDSLRAMTLQTPILNAVVMTRTRQVQRFCRISESDTHLPGFEIRHIDRKHQLTVAEQEKIAVANRFMQNCGSEFSARARKALRRDSFSQFMGKATRDSLILDSVGIETERRHDKNLGIAGLYLIDGATIRLCPETGYHNHPDLFAVQVVNGLIRTAYTVDDLIYEPRNSRADVTAAGYGLPETELLVRVVTGFLNAMTLNNNVFDKNAIPKGILHLSGNYSQDDLNAFKRYWHGMVKGLDSHLTVPVLVSKDQESRAAFEKFGVDFNEMMFAKWMTFLTSIICAIYGMSPSEINFDSFTGGSTSALSGNDTAEKLAASKDSGLRPLLSYFENLLTDYVVSELDEYFCFRWTGLDVEDQGQKYELRKTLLTLNELRAEEGYEKLDGALGDAPVDASLLNAWMQLQAQPQQDQMPPEEEQDDDQDQEAEEDDELKKSFDHHAGRKGQRGGSLPKGVEQGHADSLPPSSGLKTFSSAHNYYQAYLGGKSFAVVVNTKSGSYPITVLFERENSHAYTRSAKEGETPEAWDNRKQQRGPRVFDPQRAIHMGKLLRTLQNPVAVLGSHGRNVYVSSAIDDRRYQVVVLTVHSHNECELSTAYVCDNHDVKRLKETLRPVKPAQLKKSAGLEPAASINFLGLIVTPDLLASSASALGLSDNPPAHTIQVQASAGGIIDPEIRLVNLENDHEAHAAESVLHKAIAGDYDDLSPDTLIHLIDGAANRLNDGLHDGLIRQAMGRWLDGFEIESDN